MYIGERKKLKIKCFMREWDAIIQTSLNLYQIKNQAGN